MHETTAIQLIYARAVALAMRLPADEAERELETLRVLLAKALPS